MNKIGPNIKPPGFGNSSESINKKGESATNAKKKRGNGLMILLDQVMKGQ